MKIKKVGEKLKLLLGGSKKKLYSLFEWKGKQKKGGWKLKLVFGSFRK